MRRQEGRSNPCWPLTSNDLSIANTWYVFFTYDDDWSYPWAQTTHTLVAMRLRIKTVKISAKIWWQRTTFQFWLWTKLWIAIIGKAWLFSNTEPQHLHSGNYLSSLCYTLATLIWMSSIYSQLTIYFIIIIRSVQESWLLSLKQIVTQKHKQNNFTTFSKQSSNLLGALL